MSTIQRYEEAKAKYAKQVLQAVLADPLTYHAMSPGYVGSGDFSFAGSAAPVLGAIYEVPELLERARQGNITNEETTKYAAPVFDWLAAKTDPTADRVQRPWKFAAWIAETYSAAAKSSDRIYLEDIYKIRDDLRDFESFQQQLSPAERDIRKYKSYKQLEETLRPHQQKRDAKHAEAARRRMDQETLQKIMTQTSLIYSGPEGKIVVPHTTESCIYWGQQTKWCVSAEKANNFFRSYNEKEPLWIYLPKPSAKEKEHFKEFTSFKFCGTQGTLYNENDGRQRSIIPCLDILFKAAMKQMPRHMRRHMLNLGAFKNLPQAVPVPRFWQNKDKVLLNALSERPEIASFILTGELSANRKFILEACNVRSEFIEYAAPELLADRQFMLKAVNNYDLERILSKKELPYYADKEFILEAIKKKAWLKGEVFFGLIDPALNDDKEFIKAVLTEKPLFYAHIKEEFREDREIKLHTIKSCPDHGGWETRKQLGDSFVQDSELLMLAFDKYPVSLQDVPAELWKGKREVLLKAIGSNADNIEFVPHDQRDKEFVLAHLRGMNYSEYRAPSFPELEEDKEIALAKIKVNPASLEKLPKSMRDDFDVVMAAVSKTPYTLQYASEKMRSDFRIVSAAIRQSSDTLEYATAEMKANKDIILQAVALHEKSMQHASHDLRANREVVLLAETLSPGAANYATLELRLDKKLKWEAKLKRAWHNITGIPVYTPQAQPLALPAPKQS